MIFTSGWKIFGIFFTGWMTEERRKRRKRRERNEPGYAVTSRGRDDGLFGSAGFSAAEFAVGTGGFCFAGRFDGSHDSGSPFAAV